METVNSRQALPPGSADKARGMVVKRKRKEKKPFRHLPFEEGMEKYPQLERRRTMGRSRSKRSGGAGGGYVLQKPSGQLGPRVEAVGPERFGILCFDCAKDRSRYLLADFYGRVLIEPTTLPHTSADFKAAV